MTKALTSVEINGILILFFLWIKICLFTLLYPDFVWYNRHSAYLSLFKPSFVLTSDDLWQICLVTLSSVLLWQSKYSTRPRRCVPPALPTPWTRKVSFPGQQISIWKRPLTCECVLPVCCCSLDIPTACHFSSLPQMHCHLTMKEIFRQWKKYSEQPRKKNVIAINHKLHIYHIVKHVFWSSNKAKQLNRTN